MKHPGRALGYRAFGATFLWVLIACGGAIETTAPASPPTTSSVSSTSAATTTGAPVTTPAVTSTAAPTTSAPVTTTAPTTTSVPEEAVVLEQEEPEPRPTIPDASLVTVRIGGGDRYPNNLWAASKELGIAEQLNIDLDISGEQFLPITALQRGQFDLIAACPACALGLYETMPEFRNWITACQWKGFQVVGRADPDTGRPAYKPWEDYLVETGGDVERANQLFSASLAGRSFAILEPAGHPVLEALLHAGGIDLDAVEVIGFATVTEAADAFVGGEGDYHIGDGIQMHRMLTDPELKDALVPAAPFHAFGPAGLWYSTFASSDHWLAENEETALRLLAIWYRTTRYLHNRTEMVLAPMHEAVRRAGGEVVSDEDLIDQLLGINSFVRFQDAWDHYFADGSATNMDLSIAHSHQDAVEAGTVAPDSDWRMFEVEKDWFEKLRARPDLVAWIMEPL